MWKFIQFSTVFVLLSIPDKVVILSDRSVAQGVEGPAVALRQSFALT
jgi:hypothetical protein